MKILFRLSQKLLPGRPLPHAVSGGDSGGIWTLWLTPPRRTAGHNPHTCASTLPGPSRLRLHLLQPIRPQPDPSPPGRARPSALRPWKAPEFLFSSPRAPFGRTEPVSRADLQVWQDLGDARPGPGMGDSGTGSAVTSVGRGPRGTGQRLCRVGFAAHIHVPDNGAPGEGGHCVSLPES